MQTTGASVRYGDIITLNVLDYMMEIQMAGRVLEKV